MALCCTLGSLCSTDELDPGASDVPVAEEGGCCDLVHHGRLVRCAMDGCSREEADVVVVAKERHHRVDLVRHGWSAGIAVFGWNRDPSTLGHRDELSGFDGAVNAAEHQVRLNPEAFSQFVERDEVLAVSDEVVGELRWPDRHGLKISIPTNTVSLDSEK